MGGGGRGARVGKGGWVAVRLSGGRGEGARVGKGGWVAVRLSREVS